MQTIDEVKKLCRAAGEGWIPSRICSERRVYKS